MDGMTPHQAWYGKRPGVEHLRVFGCSAYIHVPKDERAKLDSKTRKCILLGYGSVQKGYRVYDETTQKILHSRNVTFNEVGEPIAEKSAPTSVDLDVSDGPDIIMTALTAWHSKL